MYYKLVGNIISNENAKGKLTEDLVGMYLHRLAYKHPSSSITYDNAAGGADFILTLGGRKLVIEVGAGSKDYRQVTNTMKKVVADYGLVISDDSLTHSKEVNAVKIPLSLFLLI